MKTYVRRFCLIVLGIFIAVASTEIYLRFFKPQIQNLPAFPAYDAPCFEKGDYYGYRLKKNYECILKSTFGAFPDIKIKTNLQGLRSSEILAVKSQDSVRILFVGDSFTMGWGVAQDKSYPEVIGNILRARFPDKKIEIVNAGLVGTSMGYSYEFLKFETEKIKPDIVVVGFYPTNDVLDVQLYSEWTELDPWRLAEKIDSRSVAVSYDGRLRLKTASDWLPFPINQSHLATLLKKVYLQATDRKPKGRPIAYLSECVFEPRCHDLEIGKDKVKKLFLGMARISKENNFKLIVVGIPAEIQVRRHVRMKKYLLPYSIFPDKRFLPAREFGSFLEKSGIEFLDLIPTFDMHVGEETYFAADDHWNESGHEIAGVAVAQVLSTIIKPNK